MKSPLCCVGFEAKCDILAGAPDRRIASVRVRFLLDKSNRVFDYLDEDILDCEGREASRDRYGDDLSLDARRKYPDASASIACWYEGSHLVRG